MCTIKNLHEQVKVIAIFLVCLILITGISSIVHGGDLEASLVGIVVSLSITSLLFYGAKNKDTCLIIIWLVLALLQIVGLLIGVCYFAYVSQLLLESYNNLNSNEAKTSVSKSRLVYIVYSVICSIIATILTFICIVVKKFYDELKRREPFRPQGK